MGCATSKQGHRDAVSSPDSSIVTSRKRGRHRRSRGRSKVGFGGLEKIREESGEGEEDEGEGEDIASPETTRKVSGNQKGLKKGKRASFSIKFGRLSEDGGSGWPAWLTAVAREAIDGWLPLRSDRFQRLEKIGQGTYSSVYRARDLETGKLVALKKVRFDNFQPDSVRFMAREITVLRRLDHPNIMKLEGIITSRSSCSIYLVFEYMEHDLAGLLSNPEIKFSDSQIKCFMKQLLSGLEHCHSRGIMHRDIKVSNILVNNEGVLKIGDFGLANFVSLRDKQPLTSRVVTLWYRPPELLLGSNNYGVTVDLWSAGCVFAELFFGRPLLKGRTEVEQLHKIFKLCGSPPDDYWEQSKLPLAAIFKPQFAYESMLHERCKELPKSAVNLIETLLSIEPSKRGTASSSLNSEYFHTKPYACNPSSMPKFPPNREIDAKFREEARRRKAGSMVSGSGSSRGMRRLQKGIAPSEDLEPSIRASRRSKGSGTHYTRGATVGRMSLKVPYDTVSEAASQTTDVSQGDSICTVPVHMIAPSSYRLPKFQSHDLAPSRIHTYDNPKELSAVEEPLAFHSPDVFPSQELSVGNGQPVRAVSGPLSYQSHRKLDGQAGLSVRRSRFYKDV